MVAIGERQFERLEHGVGISGAVVAERPEVVALEQAESLQQNRSLAPRPTGIDVDAGEGDALGLFDLGLELGKVRRRQVSAIVLVIADDGSRDVAAVEASRAALRPASRPLRAAAAS